MLPPVPVPAVDLGEGAMRKELVGVGGILKDGWGEGIGEALAEE